MPVDLSNILPLPEGGGVGKGGGRGWGEGVWRGRERGGVLWFQSLIG